MIKRIEEKGIKTDKILDTIKNFVKLFIIDTGAVETISKDEWSRKINLAIRKREIKEKKIKGVYADLNTVMEPKN